MADLGLSNLEKTLFLPLWARAKHSAAGNPILTDAKAVEAAARFDSEAFTAVAAAFDALSLGWVARAKMFDDEVGKFLARYPEARIVNLGAGLDTTFYRVDNGRLAWYNLDLPKVIELRKRVLAEEDGGRLRNIGMSLFDPGWQHLVRDREKGVLFLSSGVLYYFPRDEVQDLFERLGAAFPSSELVLDAVSELGMQKMNERLAKAFSEEAAIKWGLNEAKGIEAWGRRFRLLDSYALYERLDLGSFASPELREHVALTNRYKVSVLLRLGLGVPAAET